jgi:NADPH:quinone reductase-like Zn-dependent oxidoreductase
MALQEVWVPLSVQLARSFGAEVPGVSSTSNLDLVRSLGADQVIDYTREDFAETGETYDVIFDAVDKLKPARGKRALKKTGVYLNVAKDSSSGGDLEVQDFVFLKELVEAGKLKSVIDRRYLLEDIVEAHRYVEKGHKKGNVVITLGPPTKK